MDQRPGTNTWRRSEAIINRSDLVQALSDDGYQQSEAVVTRVLDVIGMALSCGESVSIRNFGKFEPRVRGAVTRRHPKTGTPVDVPAKHSVGFVPAPALKARMNQDAA